MYKIIAIDLDGTLLNDKKEISQNDKMAIKKAINLGIKIVISTGRPLIGVKPILEELGLYDSDSYVILFNGAEIYSLKDSKAIFQKYLNGNEVKEIYAEAKGLNLYLHAYNSKYQVVANKKNKYTDYAAKLVKINYKEIDFTKINDNDLYIKCLMVQSEEIIANNINYLIEKYKDKYSIFRSSPIFLEFLNKNTTKGDALVYLANYLNIKKDEIMAIGDCENDITMLQYAHMGIAMENAYQNVKAIAKWISKSNNESGVAFAINNFIDLNM